LALAIPNAKDKSLDKYTERIASNKPSLLSSYVLICSVYKINCAIYKANDISVGKAKSNHQSIINKKTLQVESLNVTTWVLTTTPVYKELWKGMYRIWGMVLSAKLSP
jgi:hypothetical protein